MLAEVCFALTICRIQTFFLAMLQIEICCKLGNVILRICLAVVCDGILILESSFCSLYKLIESNMDSFKLAFRVKLGSLVYSIVVLGIYCTLVSLGCVIALIVITDYKLNSVIVKELHNVGITITYAHTTDALAILGILDKHKCLCMINTFDVIIDRIAVLIKACILLGFFFINSCSICILVYNNFRNK